MNADEKLTMIADLCRHPGSFHWTGRQMANAINRVLEDTPIEYSLSELDMPIPYELVQTVHDAVYEGSDDDDS